LRRCGCCKALALNWCDRGVRCDDFFAILERVAGAGSKTQAGLGKCGPPRLDASIGEPATRQHGVVAARQLRVLGLSTQAISQRAAAGRLHRVHHGVYAVCHRVLTTRGRWMAAVPACGSDAVLSHASAAALWEIRSSAAAGTDVSVPRAGRRSRPGLRIHRPRTLPANEVTARHGIPVTTPARTVLDLAARLTESRLESLLNEVERRELTDYPALDALARAHPGCRGAAKLRRTLATYYAGTDLTRSDLEILFRELCRDHGLPEPRVNQRIAGKEVDFLFPDYRLIVETDSWRYHKTRRSFEDDRARDVLTLQAGYRTLRFTDRRLEREPRAVAAAIATVLADRRAA
jgi:very-short-patch-repair endonuclease